MVSTIWDIYIFKVIHYQVVTAGWILEIQFSNDPSFAGYKPTSQATT